MDGDLVARLKARGLFPLEIDKEAQERYKAIGIDPSKLESHYSPGTPASVRERVERIEANVRELYELEQRGCVDSEYYRKKEDEIRKDLFELDHPPLREVLERMMKAHPMTGVIGVNRDIFCPATGLNAGHTVDDSVRPYMFVDNGDCRIIDPDNPEE